MSTQSPNQRELERRLDEAARRYRPQHPGWDTLLDRLPSQQPARAEKAAPDQGPGLRDRRGRRFRWVAAAVAAGILIALVFGWSLFSGPDRPAQAEPLPIEVRRRGIQVTVFNATENRGQTLYMPQAAGGAGPERSREASRGMALVKDQRMILHLKRGDNLVQFADVAASIDPTSVRLVSDTDPAGTKVVEQNFEFDLASADALLERSLERKIACVSRDGEEVCEGYLLSYDAETLVLADKKPSDDPEAARPRTQSVARRKLAAIRLDHVPGDLYTRPTLVWKLRTDKPGDHLTTLTYLCGNVVWQADYVATVTGSDPEEVTLDLAGWVTIDNRSGAAYQDAGLKLIAGDVNRTPDPWAPRQKYRFFVGFERLADVGESLAFVERGFFEYKLYALARPSTIRDQEVKQIGLFEAAGVKARRRYICPSTEGKGLRPRVQLLIKNDQQNHLGRPLPKGRLTLVAPDADGQTHVWGRYPIDHTAKDEELTIYPGQALDVTYDFRVVDTKRPTRLEMIRTYEFRIRNHKPDDVRARAIADLRERQRVWRLDSLIDAMFGSGEVREAATRSVVDSTDDYFWHDFRTIHFDVPVKANSEKTIRYTVDYRW